MTGRPAGEAGSGTVWLLALLALPLAATLGAVGTGQARAARHQAEAAADLAALAGAGPGGGSCDLVPAVARADGAVLRACRAGPGGTVTVAVARPVRILGWGAGTSVATARAGPADPPPPPPEDPSPATVTRTRG